MEYDFSIYATFGSDGGGEFYRLKLIDNIGYTDCENQLNFYDSNKKEISCESITTFNKVKP